MIRIISILTILTLYSCSNKVEGQHSNEQNNLGTTNKVTYEIPDGRWSYSAYLDSTVIEKSIFKYSDGPASFAYNIVYNSNKPDSILLIGYNENIILPLTQKDIRTYWAGDKIQHWVLTFNDNYSRLFIKEYMDPTYAHKADPEEYLFLKSDRDIGKLSNYFVSNILKGKYFSDTVELEITNKLVSKDGFTDYYEIKGIEGIKTFSITINFWEMVPQIDMIYFYNPKGNYVRQYNWSFSKDELILRDVEEIYEDGDFAGGKPTDTAYKLKRFPDNSKDHKNAY